MVMHPPENMNNFPLASTLVPSTINWLQTEFSVLKLKHDHPISVSFITIV